MPQIAKQLKVSSLLIDILEQGGVTHPELAKKIGVFYGLDLMEIELLMPENRRPHSPHYDPDKWKNIDDSNTMVYGKKRRRRIK